jgi:hypothetical protein
VSPPSAASRATATSLYFSTSSTQGDTWSAPKLIPTTGLNNNVFAWIAGGDAGRFDIAWYGTAAQHQGTAGPDSTIGDWNLDFIQTLDDGASWSTPVSAGEHFIHHGTIQTVMGGQVGDRTLGDFLQLRIGPQGEALISYGDSNNIDETAAPHAMFVRQNTGPGVLAAAGGGGQPVSGGAAPRNAVTVAPHTATFDNAGVSSAAQPNLTILGSSITQPDTAHYTVTMTVADLTSLSSATAGGPDLRWLTQWLVPSTKDPTGGKNFFVYMESTAGGAPACFSGENAFNANGGGLRRPTLWTRRCIR